MGNATMERTLIPAIIPPGAAHVHAVMSAAPVLESVETVASLAGVMGSLVSDFVVRATLPSSVNRRVVLQLALPPLIHPAMNYLRLRTLRLNCLTEAYADLWERCWRPEFAEDAWVVGDGLGNTSLGESSAKWSATVPLRVAADRRRALVENDALVALMLGVTADQLCAIYRTQFPVLHGYDRKVYLYDANGRRVPNSVLLPWRSKGSGLSEAERTAINRSGVAYTYQLPFVILDREADMRQAYAHFEQLLKDRS
jgi:hypothetical protein